MGLSYEELIGHLVTETTRTLVVLGGSPGDQPVPSTPGWTTHDLAGHVAQGLWRFTQAVTDPAGGEPDEEHAPPVPPAMAATLALLAEQHDRLVVALRAATPETPAWSWHDGPGTARWVARRMAHEALVHRLDAELAVDRRSPVDVEVATDGIDELLTMFVTGVPGWSTFTPDGTEVLLATPDAAWGLRLGRMSGSPPGSDQRYELEAAELVDADALDDAVRITGSADVLHAWLWGRGSDDGLRATDADVARRLRALVADATQ